VGIMPTELITLDSTLMTISTRSMLGQLIFNDIRRSMKHVGVSVDTSYDGDVNKAIDVAMKFIKKHPLVLEGASPAVVVTELEDSPVNLVLRVWNKT
jgi:small conductance mechanosensitive channel